MASGAKFNFTKSSALSVGGWNKRVGIMDITYREEVKILGVTFHGNTNQTIQNNWSMSYQEPNREEEEYIKRYSYTFLK
jgi:hypothetical protein